MYERRSLIGLETDCMISLTNQKICIIRGLECQSLLAHQDWAVFVGSPRLLKIIGLRQLKRHEHVRIWFCLQIGLGFGLWFGLWFGLGFGHGFGLGWIGELSIHFKICTWFITDFRFGFRLGFGLLIGLGSG